MRPNKCFPIYLMALYLALGAGNALVSSLNKGNAEAYVDEQRKPEKELRKAEQRAEEERRKAEEEYKRVESSPAPAPTPLPSGMATVPGGCFDMGDTFGDGATDEKPVHRVCLDGFNMDKYEVTNAQFEKWKPGFKESRNLKNDGVPVSPVNDSPVVGVTWEEAKGYCGSLGKRLPTEAQWEYAARSGGKKVKYATSTGKLSSSLANY